MSQATIPYVAAKRLRALQPDPSVSEKIHQVAVRPAEHIRATPPGPLSAESFLRHHGLSAREGVVQSKGRRINRETVPESNSRRFYKIDSGTLGFGPRLERSYDKN